jgi:hypothetical protein
MSYTTLLLPTLDEATSIRAGLLRLQQKLGDDFQVYAKAGGRYESYVRIKTTLKGITGPHVKVKLDEGTIWLNGQPQKNAEGALRGAKAQVNAMLRQQGRSLKQG